MDGPLRVNGGFKTIRYGRCRFFLVSRNSPTVRGFCGGGGGVVVGALYTQQQREGGVCLLLCVVSLDTSHSMYFFRSLCVGWLVVEGWERESLTRFLRCMGAGLLGG